MLGFPSALNLIMRGRCLIHIGAEETQVFHWRRQYRAGWFDDVAKRATALVPVKIVRSAGESVQATARKAKTKVIEHAWEH